MATPGQLHEYASIPDDTYIKMIASGRASSPCSVLRDSSYFYFTHTPNVHFPATLSHANTTLATIPPQVVSNESPKK